MMSRTLHEKLALLLTDCFAAAVASKQNYASLDASFRLEDCTCVTQIR